MTEENKKPKKRLDMYIGQKKAMIENIANGLTMTETCKAIGISQQTFYNWLAVPEFRKKVQSAKDSRIEVAEDSLLLQVKKLNTLATIFYLCNRAPERWKNVQRVDHAGWIERGEDQAVLKERKEKIEKFLNEVVTENANSGNQSENPNP